MGKFEKKTSSRKIGLPLAFSAALAGTMLATEKPAHAAIDPVTVGAYIKVAYEAASAGKVRRSVDRGAVLRLCGTVGIPAATVSPRPPSALAGVLGGADWLLDALARSAPRRTCRHGHAPNRVPSSGNAPAAAARSRWLASIFRAK